MEKEFKLKKIMIPEEKNLEEGEDKEAKCPIFASTDFLHGKTNKKRAVVLI